MFLLAWIASVDQTRAGVVFDNGSPDFQDGHGSDFDVFVSFGRQSFAQVADNFSLSTGSGPITGVTWWGDYTTAAAPVPTDDFTIRIFSDVNGSAATAPLVSLHVGQVDRTATTSKVVGLPTFKYSASIAPLTLTPNTTYWLSIVDDTRADPNQNFYWATSHWLQGNGLIRNGGDNTAWRPIVTLNGAEEAFQLTSSPSAPEPASLTLFGIGLLAIGWGRIRRSRTGHGNADPLTVA